MRYLLFLLLLVSEQAFGYSLWSVDKLDMEYFKYRSGFRDPYMITSTDDPNVDAPQYVPMQMQDGAALLMDARLLEVGYWRNRFHMAEDEHKHVRHVGWEWEAGISLDRINPEIPIELFEHHHSQHGLEYVNPRDDRFPVEDTYGIRFELIRSHQ